MRNCWPPGIFYRNRCRFFPRRLTSCLPPGSLQVPELADGIVLNHKQLTSSNKASNRARMGFRMKAQVDPMRRREGSRTISPRSAGQWLQAPWKQHRSRALAAAVRRHTGRGAWPSHAAARFCSAVAVHAGSGDASYMGVPQYKPKDVGRQHDVAEDPDAKVKAVQLPPALLPAFLRRLVRRGPPSLSRTLHLVQGIVDGCRARKHDDVSILLLQLQLWRDVIGAQTVSMEQLLPSLAGCKVGKQHVQIPVRGFLPTEYDHNLDADKLQDLMEAAITSPDQPWAWMLVDTSVPGSILVLRKCNQVGQQTGGCIVLHLKGTPSVRNAELTAKTLQTEGFKIQTKTGFDAETVIAIIADKRNPLEQNNDSDGSMTTTERGYWEQLKTGTPVYRSDLNLWVTVDFREQPWQVRGGAVLLHDMLRPDRGSKPLNRKKRQGSKKKVKQQPSSPADNNSIVLSAQ